MSQGNQWLKDVADRMKEEIASGAAPSPERLTVKQLIGRFGYQKRMDSVVSRIRNGLERHNLITDQDFAVGWIDSMLTIRLDSEVSDIRPKATSEQIQPIESVLWRQPTISRLASIQTVNLKLRRR